MATLDLATLRVLLTANASQYQSEMGKTVSQTQNFGNTAQKVVAGVVVGAFVAAGAAAAKFASESLAEFNKFQAGMAEVFTLMPGMSEAAMGEMEADVLAFGASTGRVSDEVIPGLYQAISAGVPAENVLEFLRIASDAALGGVTTLEVAVDGISSAVNAYGSEALSATMASDLMFAAVAGGKTTFDELAGSLYNVLPTAASVGVAFGDVTAALATMTSAGVPTSVATTQLRQLLIELSQSGGEAAGIFEQMAGRSFPAFVAAGGNLQQALLLMEQAAINSGVRLSDLFSSVEAGNAALSLTGAATEKFGLELDRAANAAGATEQAAQTMNNTMAHTEAVVEATSEQLKIMVGEALEPGREAWLNFKLALLESAIGFVEAATAGQEYVATAGDMAEAVEGAATLNIGLSGALLGVADAGTLASKVVGMVNAAFGDGGGGVETYTNQSVALGYAMQQLAGGFEGTGSELATLAIQYAQAQSAGNVFVAGVGQQRIVLAETTSHASLLTGALSEQAMALLLLPPLAEQVTDVYAAMAGGERELSTTTAAAVASGTALAQAHNEQKAAAAAAAAAEAELAAKIAEATAKTGDYFTQASQAATQTADWGGIIYDAADAAGAGAEALGLLGIATGELTVAEADAFLRTALLRAVVDELATAYANGEISVRDLMTAFDEAKTEIENMNIVWSEAGGYVLEFDATAGALSGTMAGLTGSAAAAKVEIAGVGTAAENAAGTYDIIVHVTVDGDAIPDIPDNAGNPSQKMAEGGFTGWGPTNAPAGVVHGQEYVFSAPAVAAIGLPVLESMHNSGAVPGGNSYQINVDARGAGPGAAMDIERAIRRILRDEVGAAERRQR